ncbi:dicer-like protein 1 [Aureobasidium pullulans EXF-150]|uniref:Dicer-like protein 1 n=1 Tax=Aureobasidium pullulans EXF-150 TaxID=1043002 RepID=A0A074XRC2_AURPU|nr:dicer-like protein 1 [Aureobasidium pullulans EXF-150]KEQ88133.1 dicer-like protein 1 [Aureobasidium pullulans EXF-150]
MAASPPLEKSHNHHPDSESDGEADVDTTPIALSSTEKRRTRKLRFQSWLQSAAIKDIRKVAQEVNRATADEELSIRELLASQETTQIITTPREYQLDLYQRAIHQNTIAVLDTGSGKTLIAVLLLRHTIEQELQARLEGKPHRISFFLVPSVPLVFQQFAVLERNLDYDVDRLCGAMMTDKWSKQVWEERFAKTHVIVCTPDVLKSCLSCSFISMRQINLLVFDEAHHAKKGHAYAQIIKDFYLTDVDEGARPRIFGMTASPVDARVDVRQAARDLENILNSKIATARDLALLQNAVTKPDEKILSYTTSPAIPAPSQLYQDLKNHFGSVRFLDDIFERAVKIRSHLGEWCADRYWGFALAEERSKKLESRVEKAARMNGSTDEADLEVEQIRKAMDMVTNHEFGRPRADLSDLSNKVQQLYNYLGHHYERPSDYRCIVFVEQRSTAYLLHKVFDTIGSTHLSAGLLIGAGNGRLDDVQSTFRNQVVTLIKFRKGELNCLFATSVAEEGLDIPDCNLVVRFDICKTMIQYVQSRGRARHKNSKFLHMREVNNWDHDTILSENRGAEHVMRSFCEALPADRQLEGDHDMTFTQDMVSLYPTHVVPSTGAKITFGSALQILSHFVDSLPKEGEEALQPTYITTNQGGRFVCEVIIPDPSPVRSSIGDPMTKKSLAKRSAAFKACKELVMSKHLDPNLVPIYTKKLPSMRNAALALSSKQSDMYDLRIKPHIWDDGRNSVPTTVYLTHLNMPQGLERPHQPLFLVTRKPMPNFPEFPLFLNDARRTDVKLTSFATACQVTEVELAKFTLFTLRIFKDLFNKTYEFDVMNTPYWLIPSGQSNQFPDAKADPFQLIDWATVDYVYENDKGFQWSPGMPGSFLVDKFYVDQWDGGRRFYSSRVAPEYKPSDPVPEGCIASKRQTDIIDYTVSLWQKTHKEKKTCWNPNQPVLEGEKILHRRNMLAEPTNKEEQERSKTRSFICPEPLIISSLPTPVVATCYVFPAIIHRIDDYLIAMETCEELDLTVDLPLALEAITKDSDNTEEHRNHERINFQRGMGKNYERLEFLGDCFLKMATSISTFTQNPNDNEFDFHVKRMLLLCNQNLFNTAQKLRLYENIRSSSFSRRTWYPSNLKLLQGKGANKNGSESMKHALGDKTIADVCEALMGAAFLTHDKPGKWRPEHWRDAVKAVTKFVDSPDHTMMEWKDYSRTYEKPAYQVADARAANLELARRVEKEHAYHFRYPRLLQAAFHHPSYPNIWSAGIPSYQRLEFLGDSLLDMTSITHLFYNHPDKDPQWLTEHKMAMVSNQFLGAVCVRLGFWKHLLFNHDSLRQQIANYVTDITDAEAASHGAMDYWTTVKEGPKCLPDIVEAYVGAMFIDADFDYTVVQRFFDEHMKPFFTDMEIYDDYANNHPVTRLHNVMQKHFGCHEYNLFNSEETVDGMQPLFWSGVMIHDHEPIGVWRAKSGRYSNIKAAILAVEVLEGVAPYEFRAKYGCDCREDTDGGDEGSSTA